MKALSQINITNDFRNAAEGEGLIIDQLIPDGKIHRCKVQGDKNGQMSGTYKLHLDGYPNGGFQNFKRGTGWLHWKLPLPENHQLTKEEVEEINEIVEKKIKLDDEEQANRHQEAAIRANQILKDDCVDALMDHTYIVEKKIQGTYGTKICTRPGIVKKIDSWIALVVPMYNEKMEIVSLNFIAENGDKCFLTGGRTKGCFYLIGDYTDDVKIYIVEGFATGCSVYEAMGGLVVIAFTCGNLLPVTETIANLMPNNERFICADNDEHKEINYGLTHAYKTAKETNSHLVIPNYGEIRNDRL